MVSSMSKFSGFKVCTVLLLFSFGVSICAAPILSPSDTDLIRDRQERLLQDQQKRLGELQQLPNILSASKPELTDETRCFEVKEINLQGATHISIPKQNQLLKPFVGQCLSASGIDALLKTLTGHYLNQGYVASRAYLPEQDLTNGILQIIVIEGRLQGFEPSELATELELKMTFPGKTGEILKGLK